MRASVFTGEGGPASAVIRSPRDAEQLADSRRSLDLVVQYQSRAGDVDGYAQFVRNAVRRYGAFTAMLQIAEEPNVAGNAALDGDYPGVLQAIASGVAAANDEARARGPEHLQVGVNSTPLFGPATGFYPTQVHADRPLPDAAHLPPFRDSSRRSEFGEEVDREGTPSR